MTVKFACTQLQNSGKKGVLKPDEFGYYILPIGGLDVFNSAGQFYVYQEAKQIFEQSSQLMRRVKRGALRGEVGHPKKQLGESDDSYLMRILTIEEKNVCSHFSELWLDFDNYKDTNGKPMVAIMAKVKPSGPHAKMLQDSLDNPKENVCFSIRSITEDSYRGRTYTRVLKNVITFDYVNEPGIHIAEKYKSTSLESIKDIVVTKNQLFRAINTGTDNGVGLENMLMTPQELFTSLGWTIDNNKPVSKW